MTDYWFSASHEQFTPSALIEQAVQAEAAGFDGIGCSDHFQPWFPDGESGNAWVWLGAAGQRTSLPLGTGVTALVHRYHPAVVAQAFITLEELYPGRTFLGVGSGEALNEIACGADWPSTGEQIERMDQALDVITRLWAGETVTADHGWFAVKEAKLHTRAASRPKLYVSAFGPQAAEVAGRYGDGVWTLADPEGVPEILDAYRASRTSAGLPDGRVILHTGIAWAASEEAVIDGARGWRGAQPDSVYKDAIGSPEAIQAQADEDGVDDDALREGFVVSADPDEHIARIREIEGLGADVVCLQNVSGADPEGTIRVYGETVLPALRG
ncbi:MAG: class flavin-dependent oxidoreductase [Solirubrobacterales bacterium]|nr:class flavin-dependent oxidoreductase [Solirubrobacterales bacterium]